MLTHIFSNKFKLQALLEKRKNLIKTQKKDKKENEIEEDTEEVSVEEKEEEEEVSTPKVSIETWLAKSLKMFKP